MKLRTTASFNKDRRPVEDYIATVDHGATSAGHTPESLVTAKMQSDDYQARVAAEKIAYRDCLNVHELPEIFHYWSDRYLRPKLEAFGFCSPDEMFKKYLEELCERHKGDAKHFASMGSGNCDLEIRVASHLRSKGHADFVIDCLDLNGTMLERGWAAAAKGGVSGHIHCVLTDLNKWAPRRDYDAIIANQTLHHIVNLEGLFARIKNHLKPDGSFLISDMIGRNGHRRWPEALDIVHEFWRKLPPSYRYNRDLDRYEERFENWDCSAEGFEGIRSQDILPLLLSQFHFKLFVGFANIIDPFIDRAFGPNFDARAQWDRAFIDAVHWRDEEEIDAGRIKPTHMLAVVGNDPGTPLTFHRHLSPQFSVRLPDTAGQTSRDQDLQATPYQWGAWPHSSQSELETACRRLNDAVRQMKELKQAVQEHTISAQALNKELNRTAGVRRVYRYLQAAYCFGRQWARNLRS
jgi:SAM-dependent methyltransferase